MTADLAERAFLGVERSATGCRWVGPSEAEDRRAEALAQATGLPLPLCRVLAARGVGPQEATSYLEPRLRDLLPDPASLRDMTKAAARFVAAALRDERIAVFADYDVDGGASAALLIVWLRALGRQATLYIPDRISEGYGPNVPAMQRLAAAHDLIVCVDCGTAAHEAIGAAAGADVLVLDHHLGAETLPPALAVVNPNRADESGALGHLCAASVVFLMLVEANRQMRAAGVQAPDLMPLLDLVALATVADVAPLVGVNRALVRQGLAVMGRGGRPGLAALARAARLNGRPGAYHLGYVLGPRVNAGGRIGRADLGARLLACDDPAEAEALAQRLEELNAERREIEAGVCAAALAQAEARGFDAPLVWAAGEGWHPGVLGIVASRLKEAAQRPAVVIGISGAQGTGSGRSVEGVDLGAAIQRLVAEGLAPKGGGHRMAAGLTVRREGLEPAMARLSDLLARPVAAAVVPRALRIDGLLMPAAATEELCAQMEAAGPYGAGSPAPRFALGGVLVASLRPMSGGHLRARLKSADGPAIEAVCFGAEDCGLGPLLREHAGRRLHVAGRLELNEWNGRRSVQFRLEDAAPG